MLILAVDTASAVCAAGLADQGRLLSAASEAIGKGHAEYLMGQIAGVMSQAHKNFADITRLGVNIGPGSFTGVRVGIAAARGLALALGKPVVGISAFEALAYEAACHYSGQPVTVVLEAYRGALYVQDFDAQNRPAGTPRLDTAEAVAAQLPPDGVLTGSGAQKVATLAARPLAGSKASADIATYALLAGRKPPAGSPAPLYMRAPDARPQTGFALPRA